MGGSRIVGGHDAMPGSWPWIVSLQVPTDYSGQGFGHSCGGYIVNQWWIMTAAHCFKGVGDSYLQWRLVLGANQLSDLGGETEVRRIAQKIEHADYNPRSEANDAALLLVDSIIKFNDYIQPACLPQRDVILEHLTDCFIAGWGLTDQHASEPSDVLQEAPVGFIDLQTCNSTNWYNGDLGAFNLCAGYEIGGIDSCQGDSGGPLMCRRPQTKVFSVIGVTSWGYGCAKFRSPGVYTSVQYFLDWIISNVAP
ncbi:acrosin-like [Rana temporaria]|uniref:acrosin-like n=1 Tax=Rana temporaria TaxID=8407 RepID=UPI001AADB298|nr:acrosin-like [Rana temporaria]